MTSNHQSGATAVKRYRLSLKDGVTEDRGDHDYHPSTTSLSMVLATDYDALAAERDELRAVAQQAANRADDAERQLTAAQSSEERYKKALVEIRRLARGFPFDAPDVCVAIYRIASAALSTHPSAREQGEQK